MKELEQYRTQIDALDEQLTDILGQRFEIVRAVGRLKAKNDIAVVQSARAQNVIAKAADMAQEKGVPRQLVEDFYKRMIDYAHEIENEILAEDKT